MATTTDYINSLKQDKTNLVNNLVEKGIEATEDETFTSLVPKVLDIQSGGGTPIKKGLVINECNSDGYPIDASIVGMTEIPAQYFREATESGRLLSRIGSNLHLPENLEAIGEYAFSDCTNLLLEKLPSRVISIARYAFNKCTNLALKELPEGITSLPSNAFNQCTLLSLEKLPSGLISMDTSVFSSCPWLVLTELPEGLKTIGQYAFQNCIRLAIKELPSSLSTISPNVFPGCTGLTEITCLGNINLVGARAFYGCSNLNKFVLSNITSVTALSNISAFTGTPIESGTGYIYVPDTLLENFKEATNWSTYADQIKGVSELV